MREEEHLQECRELIAENIRRYEAQVEERHRQTQELVKAVQSGNVELYDQMFTSQSLEEHSRNQLAHNKAAYEKPFFGRIDYRNLDERLHESIYIGKHGIQKDKTHMVIVDWRAPIATVYYENELGQGSYQIPDGSSYRIDLELKRTYDIENGRLQGFYDSDVAANDELLVKYLSKNRDVVLGDIIATIQKEQNAIIRNTSDRIMVIQGAAGSGKTSIALHRIAYLLYHDRKNLKSSSVLVLSPNGVFSDYISHILPELGEENIREMSFDLFAYKRLKNTVSDCEDRYDLIERQISGLCDEELLKEKQSRDFLDRMEGYLAELEDSLMNFRDIEHRGVVKKEQEIIELFYFKFMDIPLLSRMDAVAEYFIDEVETLKGFDLPEEERDAVKSRFYRMYETRDLYVLYNRFLRQEGFPALPQVQYEKRKLRYEDVYPVLYLKYRLSRQAERSNIKHLVIDEMQDYSRLQYLIIRRMFSCKMTILGDRAQTMADHQQDVLQFLPGIFGKDLRRIEMRKSYRNTVEIASYAANLIGVTDLELFERHGMPVLERDVTDLEAALREAVDTLFPDEKTYETAAVIVPDEKTAERAYLILREILAEKDFDCEKRLSWLNRDSSSFKKGLTVTTFYLAKGLEFDQVFSIFPKDEKREMMMQAQYIAATRALHELRVYHI